MLTLKKHDSKYLKTQERSITKPRTKFCRKIPNNKLKIGFNQLKTLSEKVI